MYKAERNGEKRVVVMEGVTKSLKISKTVITPVGFQNKTPVSFQKTGKQSTSKLYCKCICTCFNYKNGLCLFIEQTHKCVCVFFFFFHRQSRGV